MFSGGFFPPFSSPFVTRVEQTPKQQYNIIGYYTAHCYIRVYVQWISINYIDSHYILLYIKSIRYKAGADPAYIIGRGAL